MPSPSNGGRRCNALPRSTSELLRDLPGADDACAALIDAALVGGGKDNVTVIVANYAVAPAEAEG
jgi:hypothetical protein